MEEKEGEEKIEEDEVATKGDGDEDKGDEEKMKLGKEKRKDEEKSCGRVVSAFTEAENLPNRILKK